MITEDTIHKTSKEFKNYEIELHRELMNSCRRYIKNLGIFSILGILDYVKQEVIELESATSQDFNDKPTINIE